MMAESFTMDGAFELPASPHLTARCDNQPSRACRHRLAWVSTMPSRLKSRRAGGLVGVVNLSAREGECCAREPRQGKGTEASDVRWA